MKSTIILALGVSLLSIALAFTTTSSAQGIVFAWSNYGVFNGVNLQEVSDVECNQISRAVSHKDSGISKYIGASKAVPEVLVVFVQPHLGAREFPVLAQAYASRPNGGAFHKLKEFLETSSSSLSIPNAHDSRNHLSENFPQYLQRDFKVDSIITAGDGQSMSIEQLLEKLNGNWEILNNGKTDLIVVRFSSPALITLTNDASVSESFAQDDTKMGQIISAVEQKQVDYIAFFVGQDSAIETSGRIEHEQMRVFRDAFPQDTLYTTNWTPEINQGLLVIIPFIFIVGSAIRCTFSLQSSLDFEAEKKLLKGIRQ